MRMKLLIVAGVFALIASPLNALQSPQQAQPQVQPPPGFPAQGQPPTVTLISPGAQPRNALRYKFPSNSNAGFEVSMTMSMTMDMGGMQMPAMNMPAMRMSGEFNIKDVSPQGDAPFEFVFGNIGIDSSSAVDPNIAAAMQGMLAGVKDLRGSGAVTNRGYMKSVNLDLSKVDPAMQQTMGSMTSSIEQMTMPFPEEPVGAGAKWEVRQSINSGGMWLFQKVTVELTAVDSQGITVTTNVEQTAPPQTMTNAAMAGASISLESMSGTGSGMQKIRFDSPVPTGEGTSKSKMVMNVDMGGGAQKMSVENTMKMTMAPKAKK